MRTGIMVFGVILLVLGGIFYFIPTPSASATTSTNEPGSRETVSTASISIPWALTVGLLIAGFVFTLLGLALTGVSERANNKSHTSYDTESSEDTVSDDGEKKHTTHEKHVRTTTR